MSRSNLGQQLPCLEAEEPILARAGISDSLSGSTGYRLVPGETTLSCPGDPPTSFAGWQERGSPSRRESASP